jgi:hypothetical protein
LVDNSGREWKSQGLDNYKELYYSLESIVQSINNLEEKFHQSLFFYHFIGVSSYLTISIYFCGIFIIILTVASFISATELAKIHRDKTLALMFYKQITCFFGTGPKFYLFHSLGDIYDKLLSVGLLVSFGFEDVSFCYMYGFVKLLSLSLASIKRGLDL